MNMKDIKWWLFNKKISWYLYWVNVHDKGNRKRYCNKGYHKLKTETKTINQSRKNNKGKWVTNKKHIEYLTCENCNYLFFATFKDKIRYQDMIKSERKVMSNFFKGLSENSEAKHRWSNGSLDEKSV